MQQILLFADMYEMNELKRQSEYFFAEKIKENNVIAFCQLALEYNCDALLKFCVYQLRDCYPKSFWKTPEHAEQKLKCLDGYESLSIEHISHIEHFMWSII